MTATEAPKRALICGVSGQDGAYLAELLLGKGYEVWGTTRDLYSPQHNLRRLGVLERVHLITTHLPDLGSVMTAFEMARPDEVYNLAGQSSVSLSFKLPVETYQSLALGTFNLLEAIRLMGGAPRLFQAGSAEIFGESGRQPITMDTPLRPRNPYGMSKAASFLQVNSYRDSFGLYACSGVLFNHESPLRPEAFVTRKVIAAANRIARSGGKGTLQLGMIDVYRDWGWAPEYVEAMWRMLQQSEPENFIVATGETHSLREFVETAFRTVGLRSEDHLVQDPALLRPTDSEWRCADPRAIERKLGWRAEARMQQVIERMIEADAAAHAAAAGTPYNQA